ncbi:hypothetical protein [Klebsiella sp. BIGb0407]|uniref:hypothetical protein n=1 Tax=Klebsiella sp. BIGb0407 TaxID=2940603 RepID=UPI0021676806|nr:hypothetical protein [Klebsiella sp. BIGb0407]MCS3430579.1 hypothetical protein [Klebsiella sp. BIGb0407]
MKINLDEPMHLALQEKARKRGIPLASMIVTMCRNTAKILQERDEEPTASTGNTT